MKTFYLQFDDIELQIKERSEHFHLYSIIRIMGYVSWLLLRRISLANYNGLFHLISDSPKEDTIFHWPPHSFFWWYTPPNFYPPPPPYFVFFTLSSIPPSISFLIELQIKSFHYRTANAQFSNANENYRMQMKIIGCKWELSHANENYPMQIKIIACKWKFSNTNEKISHAN